MTITHVASPQTDCSSSSISSGDLYTVQVVSHLVSLIIIALTVLERYLADRLAQIVLSDVTLDVKIGRYICNGSFLLFFW
jgi:hypothetical protein